MKINCPRCNTAFETRGINISGNAQNITLKNVQALETCPNIKCGLIFNPYKDGSYNFRDGIPILIKELNQLEFSDQTLDHLSNIDFLNINSQQELLNSIESVDKRIGSLIQHWILNGVSFLTIIFAFVYFLDTKRPESDFRNHVEEIQKNYLSQDTTKINPRDHNRINPNEFSKKKDER